MPRLHSIHHLRLRPADDEDDGLLAYMARQRGWRIWVDSRARQRRQPYVVVLGTHSRELSRHPSVAGALTWLREQSDE